MFAFSYCYNFNAKAKSNINDKRSSESKFHSEDLFYGKAMLKNNVVLCSVLLIKSVILFILFKVLAARSGDGRLLEDLRDRGTEVKSATSMWQRLRDQRRVGPRQPTRETEGRADWLIQRP